MMVKSYFGYIAENKMRTDGCICRSVRRRKINACKPYFKIFDVNSGSIKIGGVDVRDIPKDELMNTVSFVFQNSKLIKASILDNVKMGKSMPRMKKF